MTTETEQQAPQPPCTIRLVNGRQFVVPDIDAWTYIPQGIFATGHFKDDASATERNLVFCDGRVDYLDLDYEALKQFLQEQPDARTST